MAQVDIMFLAHRMPFPPDKGERIRAFHEIEYLARQHIIDLFCLASTSAEMDGAAELRSFCRRITVRQLSKAEIIKSCALAFAEREPLSNAFFSSRELRADIEAAIAAGSYDLIFVNCSSMAQYLPASPPCPVIVDFVDADSAKWAQYAKRSSFPMSWVYRREARQLSAFERQIVNISDACLAVSDKEAQRLWPSNSKVMTIGNGVTPVAGNSELPLEVRTLQPYIVFVGTMDYLPNIDAVSYFSREIMPIVRRHHPAMNFAIVGRNPTRNVRRLAQLPGVCVTGGVANVEAYLRGAELAVAPFRISQGVHNKILESIAAGLPVVCTPPPAEGLPASLREVIVIAKDTAEFADKVVWLLSDSQAIAAIRMRSERVQHELRWDHVLAPLGTVVERVVREKQIENEKTNC